jgi:hypothetical protein
MDLACVGVKAAMGLGIRDIVLDLAVQVVEALLGDDFQIIDSWWCSG